MHVEFLRPEIRQTVWRYRDALIGIAVSILGVGWAVSSVGFMQVLGTTLSIAGALLTFAGIQRGRFRVAADGRGVVAVDEGLVTYFGPVNGGAIHVDDLVQVDLAPADEDHDEARWLMLAESHEALEIPLAAVGADALFDVFLRLPGMRTGRMLDLMNSLPERQVCVWRRVTPEAIDFAG